MSYLKRYKFQIILFASALVVYANTLGHDYAWDDAIVITGNERVQQGWKGLPSLFENIKSDKVDGRYGYRPVSLLTFAIEVGTFGIVPFWAHLTNSLLYALLCAIIFLWLRQLFPEYKESLAFWATLLFVVHPLHVEVVANIKSRDEILAMLFGILALIQFQHFLRTTQWKALLFATLLFVGSFLSKESGITLVGVAFLVALLFGSFSKASRIKGALGAIGILVILLAIRGVSYSEWFFADQSAALISQGVFYEETYLGNPVAFALQSKIDLLANSSYILLIYLKQFFVPTGLLHDYGYNQIELVGWANVLPWLSLIIQGGFIYGILRFRKTIPPASFGLLFFFVNISIYLHIVAIAPDFIANRFMFVPSLGWCIALVWGMDALFNQLGLQKKRVLQSWVIVPALLLAMMSIHRNQAWKDTYTLLQTDLPDLTNCARANFNYANVSRKFYYETTGPEKERLKQAAFQHYQRTLEITDRLLGAYMSLGEMYMEFGQPAKALPLFEEATLHFPQLSVPYFQLGRYYMSQQNFAQASKQFERAIEKGISHTNSYYHYALCQIKLGNIESAEQQLLVGLPHQPDVPDYFMLLGRLQMSLGKAKDAAKTLDLGIQTFPQHADLYQAILTVLSESNQTEEMQRYQAMAKTVGIIL